MLTDDYREDEIQAMIALAELAFPINTPNNNSYKPFPKSMVEVRAYFRQFSVDLSEALDSLHTKGLVHKDRDSWFLTPSGKEIADDIRKLRPPIYYWYRDFYSAIESSPAFSEYSRRVFGQDLGQHGFSDLGQINKMLEIVKLDKSSHVLDVGCGNGKIAEYISDLTQAFVTGIDYVPEAIAQALKRTAEKTNRLRFQVGNMEKIEIEYESYDLVLSIDSIYFSDARTTLSRWKRWLRPSGQMAIFYLSLDGDDLSVPLEENRLTYRTYDFSEENWKHQQLKHRIVGELKEAFEAEGKAFIWENLRRESISSHDPYDPSVNKTRRYLYIVRADETSRPLKVGIG